MYDFMYAIVSSLFADFHLEIHLDASEYTFYSLYFLLPFPLPPS